MSQNNFTVVINLSNFFNDHRHRARIFINEKIRTIKDFQNKITSVFDIENFFLTAQNEFLPPTEDIKILRGDDIIWVIPSKSSNYENAELKTIENSTKKSKRSKRKSSSITNELDIDVAKNKKQRKYSIDIQEDDIITKPSKKDVKAKYSNEENESVKSSKIGRSKQRHEEIQQEIPKSSKKKKKIREIEVEKDDNSSSIKKNISGSNKINYLEKSSNDYRVTVGNSLPENVSLRKATPVPTITDEYLKEKKVNIVKIDYVCKPTETVQRNMEAPPAITLNIPNTISNEKDETETDIDNNKEKPINSINYKEVKNVSNTIVNGMEEEKVEMKKIPRTKFFFTPSSVREQTVNPIEQKRRNMFMLEDKNIEISQIVNHIKQKRSNMFKLEDSPLPFINKNKNIEISQGSGCEDNAIDISKTTAEITENKNITENENITENKNITEKENVTESKQVIENIKPKPAIYENANKDPSTFNTQDNTNIISLCTPEIVENEPTTEITYPLFNKHSHDDTSCEDISKISPRITNMLDTPTESISLMGISGIQVINYGKSSERKQISGVGHLLDTIRKSESEEVFNESANGDIIEYVTKRKRTRVRKRRNQSRNSVTCETSTPTQKSPSYTPKPLLIGAHPKQHIKFSEDDEEIEDKQNDEEYVISEGIEENGIQLVEENILKAPLMNHNNMEPEINNIIAFKILKISDQFTPEVSSYIIGRVVHFIAKSQLVTLEVTFGLDQFETPKGKLSLNNNEKGTRGFTVYKECLWTDLIEPRLID